MLGHRYGWVPPGDLVPDDIRQTYQWIDGTSVTHMEIAHAVLRQPGAKALFMLRDDAYLSALPEGTRQDFVESDWKMKSSLDLLKYQLKERYGPAGCVIEYSPSPCGLDASSGLTKVQFCHLDKFATSVYDFLSREIDKQYPLLSAASPQQDSASALEQQLGASQESFMYINSKSVLGRDLEIGHVLAYLSGPYDGGREGEGEGEGDGGCTNITARAPLLVHAYEAGLGMSSVLSAVAAQCHSQGMEDNSSVVFFHSLQCTHGMDTAHSPSMLLTRLCLALGDENIRREVTKFVAAMVEGRMGGNAAPEELFHSMLRERKFNSRVQPDSPAFIFIDAIEEIRSDAVSVQYVMNMFPLPLPLELRVVMSTKSTFLQESFESLITGNTLSLSPLGTDDVLRIIKAKFADFNKTLDDRQLACLVNNPGCTNMTWLNLAVEELRVFGVFETLTEYISSLPSTVFGLMELYLQRMVIALVSVQNGKMLALFNTALRYLFAAACGLMEHELIELLNITYYTVSPGDTVASVGARTDRGGLHYMTYEEWSRIYVFIKLFLKTSIPAYLDDSRPFKPRFMLRSETIRRVIEAHILSDGDGSVDVAIAPQRHQLVNYFEKCADELRVLEEYPSQLIAVGDFARLKAFIRTETFSKVRFQQRLFIARKMRCMAVILPASGGFTPPKNEMMCVNCSMKHTFHPRRYNKSSCYLCGGEVFSLCMMVGGQPKVQQHMHESLVYMCRQHNIRAYQTGGPAKIPLPCLVCKLPLSPMHCVPAILCRMCSMSKDRCCEFRSS